MNRRIDMINRGRGTGRAPLEDTRKAHPLAFAVGSLLLCVGTYSLFPDSPPSMPLVATLASALLASALFAAAGLQGLPLKDSRATASRKHLVAVSTLLIAVVVSLLQVSGAFADAPTAFGKGFDGFMVARQLAVCFAYCLLTGIFEETVFRGLFYSTLIAGPQASPTSRIRADCAQAVLFGVMHAGLSSMPPAVTGGFEFGVMLLRFFSALLFAFLLTRILNVYGGIAAPVAVHALYDFILFAPLLLMVGWPDGPLAITAISPSALALQTALLAVAVFAVFAAHAVRGNVANRS